MLFDVVNAHLSAKGIKIGTGSIMDATIIAAPSSTKTKDGKQDPEMHQNLVSRPNCSPAKI